MLSKTDVEPRWVTKVFRLFPHPLFAGGIAWSCLMVAFLFSMFVIVEGMWFVGLVAIPFATGAYFINVATIIRRRCRPPTDIRHIDRMVWDPFTAFARHVDVVQYPSHRIRRRRRTGHRSRRRRFPVANPIRQSRSHQIGDTTTITERRTPSRIPTSHLFLHFATCLVWEAKAGALIIGTLRKVEFPAALHHSLTMLGITVTLITIRVGWRDVQQVWWSAGTIELTRPQVMMIVGMVLFSAIAFVVIIAPTIP